MPEDSGKEPTEKEQQERFEKCVPKEKHKTRQVRPKTPKDLANFLLSFGSYNAYLTGARIKNKFPQLRMSVKRINEFMETLEFHDSIREQIPEINRRRDEGMYDCLYLQYFEGQMQLRRGKVLLPDAKSLEIFGLRSGKLDPMHKIGIYDGNKLDAEKQKQVNDEVVNALLNKIKREQQEKEGTVNGDK